jgi:hypothetical protein
MRIIIPLLLISLSLSITLEAQNNTFQYSVKFKRGIKAQGLPVSTNPGYVVVLEDTTTGQFKKAATTSQIDVMKVSADTLASGNWIYMTFNNDSVVLVNTVTSKRKKLYP